MIGLTYRLYIDTNRKPPTKPQDLAKYMEGGHAMEGMTSGKYIVYWNADLDKLPTNPSTTVVGYYKDVPMAGGPVVTADWSVKDMTPDQFKAAPKAGK